MHRGIIVILLIEYSIAYVITGAPLLRKTKYYKNARLVHDCLQCVYLIAYASYSQVLPVVGPFIDLPNYLALPP